MMYSSVPHGSTLHRKKIEFSLIEIKEPDEIIGEILKNLFPSQTKAYIVPVSKERLAVLYPFHETKDSKDSADEHARHRLTRLLTR